MKLFLIAFIITIFTSLHAQEMQFTITALNKTITVSTDEENNNFLILNSAQLTQANSLIIIKALNKEADKDWKRSFSIYDSASSEIKEFVVMKDGSYCIKLRDIAPALQADKNYFIYTIAIPKDPKQAMLVKPARKLVCEIKIR